MLLSLMKQDPPKKKKKKKRIPQNSFGDAAKSLSEPDTADSLAENDNRVECNTSTGQKYSCGDSQLPHYFGLSVQKMDIINSKGR